MVSKTATLLRIYLGESDVIEKSDTPLHTHILEFLKKEGFSGATVLRGIAGFGKNSILHTSSILRLSEDMPIIIEVVDEKKKIEKLKPKLSKLIKEGLITEEKVSVFLYKGNKKS